MKAKSIVLRPAGISDPNWADAGMTHAVRSIKERLCGLGPDG